MNAVDVSVYAIVDSVRCAGMDYAAIADQAVRGGARLFQLREKSTDTRLFIERARILHRALAGRAPLLINDRVDVALASGADGVHLGREDMMPSDARKLLGARAIIGITIKNSDDLALLHAGIVDYGCIGGVFQTVSKDNPDTPVGLAGLAELRRKAAASGLPVGAIAGIDATNAADVIAAGADGVAVVSAIFRNGDITAATRALAGVVDGALAARRW